MGFNWKEKDDLGLLVELDGFLVSIAGNLNKKYLIKMIRKAGLVGFVNLMDDSLGLLEAFGI